MSDFDEPRDPGTVSRVLLTNSSPEKKGILYPTRERTTFNDDFFSGSRLTVLKSQSERDGFTGRAGKGEDWGAG